MEQETGHIEPRKRFIATLVFVYMLSLPVISFFTYTILRHYAIEGAYERGSLYLTAVESVKHYVQDELRPVLYDELPGRFVLEGMSRTYISGRIARRVNSEYPGYFYKHAQSQNPRNPENLADPFESSIIEKLTAPGDPQEWRGTKNTREGKFFVIARKGKPYSNDCLRCHGSPADAPPELISRFGPVAGFNLPEGKSVSAKFVYIPISPQLATARGEVMVFIGLYSVFFFFLFLYINRRSADLYGKIEAYSRNIERINADLAELNSAIESMAAERTLGMMALTVADRVRNPAAVIGTTCHQMLDHEDEELPKGMRSRLELILEEAGALEKIVSDFEKLVRSRRSHFSYEDLNIVVMKLMPVLESEARKKGVALSFAHTEGPLYANIEHDLMKSALYHLVSNAIEATPGGSEVRIETSMEERYAVLTVSDKGEGIAPDAMDKVFEPFFSTRERGYGLGLPLVKQIVAAHMGSIDLKSTPGAGSTFTVRLPLRWEAPPGA
jgi:signal transduction histidine kinase